MTRKKKPISRYAKQSQEVWNKYMRIYQSGSGVRARQIHVNTQNIFICMAKQTHLVIASQKRQLKCCKCAKIGHLYRI